MVKMLDTRFGVICFIHESRVNEYIKRGYRLADAPASEEVEVKKPRKPRTKKQ